MEARHGDAPVRHGAIRRIDRKRSEFAFGQGVHHVVQVGEATFEALAVRVGTGDRKAHTTQRGGRHQRGSLLWLVGSMAEARRQGHGPDREHGDSNDVLHVDGLLVEPCRVARSERGNA